MPQMKSTGPVTWTRALATASLIAALIAIGCGGDDENRSEPATSAGDQDSTTTGPAPTKEEWIERADEICAPGEKEIERTVDELFRGSPPSQQESDRFATETLVPTVQGEIDEVRELPPPPGDEEEIARILDSAQEGVDQLEAEGGLIERGGGPFIEANLLAQQYGLRICGWV
jgi:hypothetical protein